VVGVRSSRTVVRVARPGTPRPRTQPRQDRFGSRDAGRVVYLSALSALISTALALLVTDWISDGPSIDGMGTWLLATLLVWAVAAIVGVLLGRIVLRKVAAQ
jgi:hypothetical protein